MQRTGEGWGGGASEWDLYGGEDGGISGREIWIAARLRHKKSFLTKSHFDMTAAAMNWTCLLHGDPTVCIGRINHNKSAHWRDSAGFLPWEDLALKGSTDGRRIWKNEN